MTAGYELELFTVRQAAEQLFKSEQGVRRLAKHGKLKAIKEGGRLLFTPESLEAYAASLPHPLPLMRASYCARDLLTYERLILDSNPWFATQGYQSVMGNPYLSRFLPVAVPVCHALLAALKVKDYRRAEEQWAELARIHTDYTMLYAPIEAEQPRLLPKQRAQKRPPAEQPSLLGGSP